MRAVLLVEEDTLIRELMREHLEREGYPTCAVATVRVALNAAQWTRFGLVLLDFSSAGAAPSSDLDAVRALGAPVVMMRSAPAGTVIGTEGEIEQVVWSPFDLSTLTQAVRRFLPTNGRLSSLNVERPELTVTQSGTYEAAKRFLEIETGDQMNPLPAEPHDSRMFSLEALGELVLEATNNSRKVG